ncbi:dephospho-CoA kinase [Blochmannia endosymbiont of Colobopsis nipponica]|uniref:dephospho-CoA kinase n=1 Tax=Blochmannia endosymbiont of Colobopsis nipponica TaxID=2681987 RepID=UPI00178612D7|nr:dephospho-CoA kinase [Blochmannia endosymbiont of Colobopsis nipponica]QOI11259.1 dephospho-CoA kinase [Blochmannia endosymbiont of Colobopsis nipponica]
MNFIIALTGGICSGKSTISNIFSHLGITVIDADCIARKILQPKSQNILSITERFGMSILNQNGTLNRKILRKKIFNNTTDRIWLNKLLHPLIRKETKKQFKSTKSPYIIWNIPLLVENNLKKIANRILVIDTNPDNQIIRIINRDNICKTQAKKILDSQTNRQSRLNIAHDLIQNDRLKKIDIINNIIDLHKFYLKISK